MERDLPESMERDQPKSMERDQPKSMERDLPKSMLIPGISQKFRANTKNRLWRSSI